MFIRAIILAVATVDRVLIDRSLVGYAFVFGFKGILAVYYGF
jgi:hypothetical protein